MKLDCADIHQRLLAGEPVRGPEAEAHLADCSPCAELAADGGALAGRLAGPPPVGSIDGLQRRTTALLTHERGPLAWLRSRPTPLRVGFAWGLLFLLTLLAGLFAARPDLEVYPVPRLALAMAGMIWVGAAAGWHALLPLQRRALGRADWIVPLAMALGFPLLLAVLPQAHTLHPASLAGTGADFLERALRCFSFGVVVGLPALLLVAAMVRAPRMSGPAWLAAALAGVAGNLVLQLDCPITHPEHLLAGHATVGLGLVALSAVALAVVRARAG